MQLLLATTNKAKIARFKRLFALMDPAIVCLTSQDLGLESIEVDEGSDLVENAKAKVLAYRHLTDLPIIGNDTAFYLSGDLLDPVQVKRNALQGRSAEGLRQEEIAQAIVAFYQKIVRERGESIPAYWKVAYACSLPHGQVHSQIAQRHVLLTDQVVGDVNPFFPLRSMYRIDRTGKYAAEQSGEDEKVEMQPNIEALTKFLKHLS